PTAAPPTATPLPAFVPALGTRPEITAQESLYLISSATRDPEINVESWRLKIFGAVDQPYELTYAELLALPRQDQTSTLECISNEVGNLLIGNCNWNGVRLRDLLERAGVQAGVVDIRLKAAEGYTESLPLDRALDPTTLVAYGIDGQSLTVPHGFPARLRIAGKYGVKNVKWLTEIEAVREDYQGYWQQRGWTDDATIFTTSVYDTGNPRLGSGTLQRQNDVVALGGIAFAGDRGIRQVEIQIDGAGWQAVQLKEALSDSAWRQWRYDWRGATPGKHTLAVRAVDGAGQPQVDAIADTHPNGATGYHTLDVEVQ
ncbi:MAG: molybdopterin-dependent oxidoreductase, partial [Herpetosiphonaceae bacterium]|nr:molybdopterin-dependent oxidoreductase [Herpetosiphonaceae bacterium]